MAWSEESSPETKVGVDETAEQFFTAITDLKPKEMISIRILANFVVSPTDDLLVEVFAGHNLSGGGQVWSTIPAVPRRISSDDGDQTSIIAVRADFPALRVGVRMNDTNDVATVTYAFARDS